MGVERVIGGKGDIDKEGIILATS